MKQIKKIAVSLPEGETKHFSQENTLKIFKDAIHFYAVRACNPYGIATYTAEAIESIKGIRMSKKLSIREIFYSDEDILYLPECFFKENITSLDDLVSVTEKYPILKELLASYGTYIMALRTYGQSRDDILLKKLAAQYIARTAENDTLKRVDYAGKSFTTYGSLYVLEDNFFSMIEALFGKDGVRYILYYGIDSLENMIVRDTGKKGLGRKMLKLLLDLNELTEKEIEHSEIEDVNIALGHKLLAPIFEKTSNYAEKYRRELANKIAHKDFDFKRLGCCVGVDFKSLEPLTEKEREYIKLYILNFDRYYAELGPYFFKDYPLVTPRREFSKAASYNFEDFTSINKIVTMMNKTAHEKELFDEKILACWNSLLELIIMKLLPSANETYSGLHVSKDAYDEIRRMSIYRKTDFGEIETKAKLLKLIAANEEK